MWLQRGARPFRPAADTPVVLIIQVPSQQNAAPKARLPSRYEPAIGIPERMPPTRMDAEIGRRKDVGADAGGPEDRPAEGEEHEARQPTDQQATTRTGLEHDGSDVAIHGTAKASYHQSPAMKTVPITAAKRPMTPRLPASCASHS